MFCMFLFFTEILRDLETLICYKNFLFQFLKLNSSKMLMDSKTKIFKSTNKRNISLYKEASG